MGQKLIVITGGTGYVGSRLAEALAAKGHAVAVADTATPESRGVTFSPGVEFRHHDLRAAQEAIEALHGADLVVHLAADIGAMTYMRERKADILANNVRIDAALYPALVANKVPYIIYSSSSMVFQHPPQFPYTEADLPRINPPTNVYGFSKFAGEYFCRAFKDQYGIDYTIIRYHNIFGPGEDSKGSSPGDIHVIPALLDKVLSGQYPLEFHGDPPEQATRPFVFVDDAVAATVLVVERALARDAAVVNEDFNIGNDMHVTILELGKLIWSLYGDGREFAYTLVPQQSETALRREVDITKIKERLGWAPRVSLEDGLRATATWLKARRSAV